MKHTSDFGDADQRLFILRGDIELRAPEMGFNNLGSAIRQHERAALPPGVGIIECNILHAPRRADGGLALPKTFAVKLKTAVSGDRRGPGIK